MNTNNTQNNINNSPPLHNHNLINYKNYHNNKLGNKLFLTIDTISDYFNS